MDKFVCFNWYSASILKMYCHPTNKNERLDHILWYFSTDHTTWGYKYVGKQGSAPCTLCRGGKPDCSDTSEKHASIGNSVTEGTCLDLTFKGNLASPLW